MTMNRFDISRKRIIEGAIEVAPIPNIKMIFINKKLIDDNETYLIKMIERINIYY